MLYVPRSFRSQYSVYANINPVCISIRRGSKQATVVRVYVRRGGGVGAVWVAVYLLRCSMDTGRYSRYIVVQVDEQTPGRRRSERSFLLGNATMDFCHPGLRHITQAKSQDIALTCSRVSRLVSPNGTTTHARDSVQISIFRHQSHFWQWGFFAKLSKTFPHVLSYGTRTRIHTSRCMYLIFYVRTNSAYIWNTPKDLGC